MHTKDLWKNDILSKDAGQWLASLLKISYFHKYFSLFHTFCNQLHGFTASETFAANGWNLIFSIRTYLNYATKKLQSWTKLVETRVENPVNSRNGSIFQIQNSPPYINVESGKVLLSKA